MLTYVTWCFGVHITFSPFQTTVHLFHFNSSHSWLFSTASLLRDTVQRVPGCSTCAAVADTVNVNIPNSQKAPCVCLAQTGAHLENLSVNYCLSNPYSKILSLIRLRRVSRSITAALGHAHLRFLPEKRARYRPSLPARSTLVLAVTDFGSRRHLAARGPRLGPSLFPCWRKATHSHSVKCHLVALTGI